MKKLFYILMSFLPVIVSAQFNLNNDSPLDYMWKNVGKAGFSAGAAWSINLAFSPIDDCPYVCYMDGGNSRKATVMKFDGANWVNVGPAGFSAGRANGPSFAFSPSGEPWVAYGDSVQNMKATVMKFDGTNWVNVGNMGFTDGGASSLSLAFSQTGIAYVSFIDQANDQKVTVMTFDGTNWVIVGTAGISSITLARSTLAVGPLDGQPYVVWSGISTAYDAVGKKFDGSNWVDLGIPDVAAQYSMSLAFSPTDQQLYFAHGSGPVSVMKYDGTNWTNIGNTNFSAGNATYACLAFNSAGEPYVGYIDEVYNGRTTVMKFDGANWVNVGDPGFSSDYAGSPSIALSVTGQPYIAYNEFSINRKATVMKYDSVFVGINEQQKSRFSLYPNPSTDKITVEISRETEGSKLFIVNVEGQIQLEQKITQSKTQIDISTLPSGVYFVRLTNDRTVEVGKFIKK